jgi:hypothetical protein
MNDRDRLAQLRGMLARLERMPVSSERDWMLGEIRARAVDVETGIRPAAVRARSREDTETRDSRCAEGVARRGRTDGGAPRGQAQARAPPTSGARFVGCAARRVRDPGVVFIARRRSPAGCP